MSSVKFVVSALDAILASKEAQKNKELADSSKKALDAIKEHGKLPNPEIVFTPLQLATRSNDAKLTTSALDCIGKLISYSYFSVSSKEDEEDEVDQAPPLIERAIDTICDCFEGESTPVDIQLQIVKSLLAAVLNDKIVVHGAGLLKAVRQVYNVFLLSRSTANQQVAQGTLTQMVGTVFERVKTRLHMKETRLTAASEALNSPDRDEDHDEDHDEEHEDRDEAQGDQHIEHEKAEDDTSDAQDLTNADVPSTETPDNEPSESKETNGSAKAKLTLKDLEHRKSFDDSNLGDGPTTVTRLRFAKDKDDNASVSGHSVPDHPAPDDLEALEAEDEVYIRDAYLVFRSFCNLSTKVLPPDQLYDIRGQPMRSKLISLHLIHTVLNNNISVFTSPICTIKSSKSNESTTFLQAIKFYLCLSITRNGASSVDRVFEVCCEIFWLMLKFMRPSFKVSPPLVFCHPRPKSLTHSCRKKLRSSLMRFTWPSFRAKMGLYHRRFTLLPF
jgi:brefeldin A-inhibited guanine nucleotide-exchange protein